MAIATSKASPSREQITEASSAIATERKSNVGRAASVARNTSSETPPAKNGMAMNGVNANSSHEATSRPPIAFPPKNCVVLIPVSENSSVLPRRSSETNRTQVRIGTTTE